LTCSAGFANARYSRISPCLSGAIIVVSLALESCSASTLAGNDGGPDVDGSQTVDQAADQTAADQNSEVADQSSDVSDAPLEPVVGQPLTEPRSFVAHGRLTIEPRYVGDTSHPYGLADAQDFTFRLDPTANTLMMAIPGDANHTTMRSSDGVTFEITAPITVSVPIASACYAYATYSSLSATVGPNNLTGTAIGEIYVKLGDQTSLYKVTVAITGSVDTTGPSLTAMPVPLDPLTGFSLQASEPLPPTATARLVSGTETIALLPSSPWANFPVVTAFDTPNRALRYATAYDVVVDTWRDLAGNPGTALPTLITNMAPPVVPEDGFESAGTTLGGVHIVDASILPPISGQKSALVTARLGPFSNLPIDDSFHMSVLLAVKPGDRVVRFALRPIASSGGSADTGGTVIRVAVPGGTIALATLPRQEDLKIEQSLSGFPRASKVWVGDVRTVEVPLPPDATSEVIFDFMVSASGVALQNGLITSACGLLPPPVSYLVDDLRVE